MTFDQVLLVLTVDSINRDEWIINELLIKKKKKRRKVYPRWRAATVLVSWEMQRTCLPGRPTPSPAGGRRWPSPAFRIRGRSSGIPTPTLSRCGCSRWPFPARTQLHFLHKHNPRWFESVNNRSTVIKSWLTDW